MIELEEVEAEVEQTTMIELEDVEVDHEVERARLKLCATRCMSSVLFLVLILAAIIHSMRGADNPPIPAIVAEEEGRAGNNESRLIPSWNLTIPLRDDPAEPNAFFMVRASGPSLTSGSITRRATNVTMPDDVVTIVHSLQPGETSKLVVELQLSVPGRYLIEVIRVYRSFDLQNRKGDAFCMSKSMQDLFFLGRVLVEQDQLVGERLGPPEPQWIANLGQDQLPEDAVLFTRMQDCSAIQVVDAFDMLVTHPLPDTAILTDTHSHWQAYDFATYDAGVVKPEPHYRRSIPGLCIAGGSHARNLCGQIPGCSWYAQRFVGKQTGEFGQHTVSMKNLDSRCKAMLVHWGQWDLGWPNGPPLPWAELESQLDTRMKELTTLATGRRKLEVWVLPASYNPLNCLTTHCPTTDFRSPPMVEEFNRIVTRTTDKHGVTVIPSIDIIGPMWDASPDFSHPKQKVLRALVFRVTSTICQTSHLCGPINEADLMPSTMPDLTPPEIQP